MSGNVHGHQLPTKGINVNPNNPVFGRYEPDPVAADIPQGLHGAPALRSEFDESPVPLQPKAANVDKVLAEDKAMARPVPVPLVVEASAANHYIAAVQEAAVAPTRAPAQERNRTVVDAQGNVHPTDPARMESVDPAQQAGQYTPGYPTTGSSIQPDTYNTNRVRNEDASLQPDPARIPVAQDVPYGSRLKADYNSQQAPRPAQDSAIDAADQNAHNAAVAAEVAEKAADDAAANAAVVHSE